MLKVRPNVTVIWAGHVTRSPVGCTPYSARSSWRHLHGDHRSSDCPYPGVGQAARAVETARCELAAEFLSDLRRLDAQLRDTRKKLAVAVSTSGTTVTGIFGAGPVIAGTVIGDHVPTSRIGTAHERSGMPTGQGPPGPRGL